MKVQHRRCSRIVCQGASRLSVLMPRAGARAGAANLGEAVEGYARPLVAIVFSKTFRL